MQNATIAQIIAHLQTLPQDAVLCTISEWNEDGNNCYSAIESIGNCGEQVYNSADGTDRKGKVIGIF